MHADREFTVHFSTGNAYDVTVHGDALTWKGIAGEDADTCMTVPVKRLSLSAGVEAFQWQEQRGYFVTFILDIPGQKGITSTQTAQGENWLVMGQIHALE